MTLQHRSGWPRFMLPIINEMNAIFGRSFRVCKTLFSLMIPVTIGVKLLKESGALQVIAPFFAPVMAPLGLPGDFAIVWISALLAGLYGGITAFFQLPVGFQALTVNQATTLSMLMLTAHAMVVELRICSRAGGRILYLAPLRMVTAIGFAWFAHRFLMFTDRTDAPAAMVWETAPSVTWIQWFISELINYGKIALVITALVGLLRLLDRIGFTVWLRARIGPVLRLVGISPMFAPMIVVGLTLGLAYGGALIIDEVQQHPVEPMDIIMGLTLMSLCHSLVEDTLLMVMFGGDLAIILVGRIGLAFLITLGIYHLFRKIGDERVVRWTTTRGL